MTLGEKMASYVINLYEEMAKKIIERVQNKKFYHLYPNQISSELNLPFVVTGKDITAILDILKLKYILTKSGNRKRYIIWKPKNWTPPPLNGNIPVKFALTNEILKCIETICEYIVLVSSSQGYYISTFRKKVYEALASRVNMDYETFRKLLYSQKRVINKRIDECIESLINQGLVKKIDKNIIYIK